MENFDRYGTVELNGDTITCFNEKQPTDKGLINGGIYLINKKHLLDMALPEVFSFEKLILEGQCAQGILKGMVFNVPFIDIGIPQDYYRAAEVL
jgi:D-glycero-alpha-D-manno-heptose 1-phosphate guanylyltransferase